MANSDILENQGKYSNNSADKNNPKLLKLPQMLPLKVHTYE